MRFRFILSALLLLSGCGAQVPVAVRHNLWTEMGRAQNSHNYHLVLIWNEAGRGSKHWLANPDLLVSAIAREFEGRSAGRMASHQIVENAADLEPWLSVWRPETPVMLVNARFGIQASTQGWAASVSGFGRFQPFLFDTSLSKKNAAATTGSDYGPLTTSSLLYAEPELYSVFASNLARQMPSLSPEETVVSIYGGKSDNMKQAQSLAESGDWPGAAKLWELESHRDGGNKYIFQNLSVASEMAGDWEEALRFERLAAERSGRLANLAARFNAPEREVMLSGMAALKSSKKIKKNLLKPDSTFAVMLLESMSNDLTAPGRVREELHKAAQRAGFNVRPAEEVEETLRKNGFTDGGQFRSSTPKELGKMVGADFLVMGEILEFRQLPLQEVKVKLSLVFAPGGQSVFTKTYHVIKPFEKSEGSFASRAIVAAASMLAKKATGTFLKEECEGIAQRFVRAWPR